LLVKLFSTTVLRLTVSGFGKEEKGGWGRKLYRAGAGPLKVLGRAAKEWRVARGAPDHTPTGTPGAKV